jgi:hypothetical protein
MAGFIPIIEQEAPVLEEELAPAVDWVEAELAPAAEWVEAESQPAIEAVKKEIPVVESAVQSTARTIGDKAEVIAQEAETEGKAVLDKLGNLFSNNKVGEVAEQCPLKAQEAAEKVWELHPFERGRAIEEIVGTNLPSNYPTIDRFENGVATSIKSIDLQAPTYQNISNLSSRLGSYIDKVSSFQGRPWAGVDTTGQVTSRVLDLVVPSTATAPQQAAIAQAVQYGATQNVVVHVIAYP